MTDDRSNGPQYPLSRQEDAAAGPPALSDIYRATPGHPDDEEGSVDLRRYLFSLVRHKWMILLLLVLGAGAGYVAQRYVTLEYVAQATIWIESGGNRSGTVDAAPMRSSQLLDASAWVDLLRSFVVLDPVVIRERLYLHPDREEDRPLLDGLELKDRFAPGRYEIVTDRSGSSYTLRTVEGAQVERGTFGDSVGSRTIGLAWQPDLSKFPRDRAVRFRIAPPRDESVALARTLKTQMDRTGNFLRLELRGEDPQRTASILNTLAERHVEVAAELKRAKVDTLVSILELQLRNSEEGLNEAEMALEGFKIATVTLPSDRSTPVAPGIDMTQGTVFNRFFNMKVELEQIRQDQDALRRAISGPGVDVNALTTVAAVQQSSELSGALRTLTEARAELRALRARYTDDHRAVQLAQESVQNMENQVVPGLVNGLIREMDTRERALSRTIDNASAELRSIPPRAIEEARLERRVAIASQLYTTLEQRYQEARLAAASSIPDIRILDEAAIPNRPVRDQKIMVLLMATLGGLGLGIAGAIVRDQLDPRVRHPDDVSRRMGLTVLGSVPSLPGKRGSAEHLTQVQEAFRTLRLNVKYAFGAAGPITVTVSSPGPGDGKSFVASNLAVSYADQGLSVLLVDGDIRRGTLHDLLKVARKPGLTDFLNGQLNQEELIRKTRFERLDVVTSGTRIRHGPELLGSPEMRELLLGFRAEYDVVIVDSPPLSAGVDPFALSTMTGNMVLVLRSGTTNRELAKSRLALVDRLPIRVLGAIMNDMPQSREYGYSYYNYAYLPGYEAVDENGGPEPTGQRKPLQVEGVEG